MLSWLCRFITEVAEGANLQLCQMCRVWRTVECPINVLCESGYVGLRWWLGAVYTSMVVSVDALRGNNQHSVD